MYPENDDQYQETNIADVSSEGDGWSIRFTDGWSFFVPANLPIHPAKGMTVRLYGKGIGSFVRGLFLDGVMVFYRTEKSDKEKREIDLYGADAADWLKRWDEGAGVWSIEMGGLGPGYEQAIQITVAEILRHLLEQKYDAIAWESPDRWKRDHDEIRKAGFANDKITALGLSGAQWGAAMSLATKIYMDGPRSIMSDEIVKDRHIQVRRTFPVAA